MINLHRVLSSESPYNYYEIDADMITILQERKQRTKSEIDQVCEPIAEQSRDSDQGGLAPEAALQCLCRSDG